MSDPQNRVWETGWDGHEQQQLQRLASLTLAEKLEWLEQAQTLVRQLADAGRDSTDREVGSPD